MSKLPTTTVTNWQLHGIASVTRVGVSRLVFVIESRDSRHTVRTNALHCYTSLRQTIGYKYKSTTIIV